jgi:hypothetical protein
MLTYNKDTSGLELYDGSAFGPVGSDSGLIHIETQTYSAVSSFNFSNNVFSSTYETYKIIINNLSSASGEIRVRLRASGTPDSTNNYETQRLTASATTVSASRGTGTFQSVGSAGTLGYMLINLDVNNPFLSRFTTFRNIGASVDNSNTLLVDNTIIHKVASSFDSIEFFPQTGTFSGTAILYGYRK